MSSIDEFILARITEIEVAAKACAEVYPAPWDVYDRGYETKVQADGPNYRNVTVLEQSDAIDGWLGERLDHIANHDPDQVLARCVVDRVIVEEHQARYDGGPCKTCEGGYSGHDRWPCVTIRLMACLWSDHPDYDRQRWATR